MNKKDAQRRVSLPEGDIVRTLTLVSLTLGWPRYNFYQTLDLAIDEIERLRAELASYTGNGRLDTQDATEAP